VLAQSFKFGVKVCNAVFMGLGRQLGHFVRHLHAPSKTLVIGCLVATQKAYPLSLSILEAFLSFSLARSALTRNGRVSRATRGGSLDHVIAFLKQKLLDALLLGSSVRVCDGLIMGFTRLLLPIQPL
jgi:hypothetical protein